MPVAVLLAAVRSAMARVRRWPPPPNWSRPDWAEEASAVGACCAVEAVREFDPGKGMGLPGFLRRRALEGVLARYRREHTQGRRRDDAADPDAAPAPAPGEAALRADEVVAVRAALAMLPAAQRGLLERVFRDGRSEREVATEASVRQQTIHVRKSAALVALRVAMEVLAQSPQSHP